MSAQPNLIEPARPAYITPRHYVRQATGMETASLLGGLANTTAASLVGATSLVVDNPIGFAIGQLLTISDGASTENVLCTAVTGSSLTVTATTQAHAGGTCVSAPGAAGSLADTIGDASAWIDNYCQRSFYGGSISETAPLVLDVEGRVVLRPRNPPATALTVLTINLMDGTVLGTDLTQAPAQIDASGRIVTVLPFVTGASPQPDVLPLLPRSAVGTVTYTYTGGYTALPWDVLRACVELTSDLLANRFNPQGAAEIRIGRRSTTTRLRGDLTGESVLVKRAKSLLGPYRRLF